MEGQQPKTGQIFVCTNRWCREKGSDATMATFSFLCPQSIPVVSVNCLGRCNKGPNARILTPEGAFVEASAVNSVEIVVQLLRTHLNLDVNATSSEALRLNYEGNVHLRGGEVDRAIECYNRALSLGDHEQEGVLLVMRGTALLQRAYGYRMRYKDLLTAAQEVLPNMEWLESLLDVAIAFPTPLEMSPKWPDIKETWPEAYDNDFIITGEDLLNRVTFTWSMYEHALSSALQDLLMATLVLPGFSQAWRRAGDALGEFRWFRGAIEYYDVALRLDEDLAPLLLPAMERMRLLEKLVENADAKGWSSDVILALMED
eukprot:gene6415-12970_t